MLEHRHILDCTEKHVLVSMEERCPSNAILVIPLISFLVSLFTALGILFMFLNGVLHLSAHKKKKTTACSFDVFSSYGSHLSPTLC